jgi:hypothetical protein
LNIGNSTYHLPPLHAVRTGMGEESKNVMSEAEEAEEESSPRRIIRGKQAPPEDDMIPSKIQQQKVYAREPRAICWRIWKSSGLAICRLFLMRKDVLGCERCLVNSIAVPSSGTIRGMEARHARSSLGTAHSRVSKIALLWMRTCGSLYARPIWE